MLRRLIAVFTLAAAALTGGAAVTPAHAAANAAGKTYRGEGDQVIRVRATKTPGIISFSHNGESNFIVSAINSRGKKDDLLVNEIGTYKGTVLYNMSYGTKGMSALEIKADGAWTAAFKPLSAARCWCAGTVKGQGDQVLKMTPSRGLRTVRATHSGESNFIVQTYTKTTSGFSDLLFNQIGSYKGKAILESGTRLVSVKADGTWTLTRR
ncbi:hypothetical protein SAMN05421505_101353 [Sinosporangium album]|uniref:Uncharacterized protein n=1 Tax=Sinosporangium album TaxID=504805 RepID=A0A1G7RD10_9ACTN|nr:hypothetical protein [Sinosporangium album]SDG08535.1 hypothetical protein SAMN05421505_101353 [Sinosporangium album]